MEVIIARFDAPLMSFGAPIVDNYGDIQPFPAMSMITGLIGNALGYDHSEFDRLQRLQERLRYASRQDRRGERIEDYQTVDLGQEHMQGDRAWTTDGKLEESGGASGDATHIRYRDYWADAIHTVALTVDPPDESPRLDTIAKALTEPERPLFIGRKTCLPAGDLYVETIDTDSLRSALKRAPVPERVRDASEDDVVRMKAWRPTNPNPDDERLQTKPVTDRRDWKNQIHVGERWIASEVLEIPCTKEAGE